jgi:hypothetical protein
MLSTVDSRSRASRMGHGGGSFLCLFSLAIGS